jgi:NADH:ubiquinone oxidoreductase subunit E
MSRNDERKENGMNEKSAENRGGVPTATACACGGEANEPELMRRLDEVLAEYKGRPGALIPVLQTAQGIFGYLPESVLKRVALALGKSYSEVAGVVSFYAFFSTHPRGRHVVRVCLGTACYVRGGKQVLEAMRKELGIEVGETSKDGMFSLEVARCFGACGLAPAMCIDEEVFKRVRPAKIREILDAYYDKGAGRKPAKKPAAKPAARSTTRRGAAKPAARTASAKKTATKKPAAKKPVAAGRRAPAGAKKGVKVHG